jgi:hypothetical protein
MGKDLGSDYAHVQLVKGPAGSAAEGMKLGFEHGYNVAVYNLGQLAYRFDSDGFKDVGTHLADAQIALKELADASLETYIECGVIEEATAPASGGGTA